MNQTTIFAQLEEIKKHLTVGQTAYLQMVQAEARAYVWGWEDRAGDPQHIDISSIFGYSYALHTAQYYAEQRSDKISLREAWQEFSRGRPVEQWGK